MILNVTFRRRIYGMIVLHPWVRARTAQEEFGIRDAQASTHVSRCMSFSLQWSQSSQQSGLTCIRVGWRCHGRAREEKLEIRRRMPRPEKRKAHLSPMWVARAALFFKGPSSLILSCHKAFDTSRPYLSNGISTKCRSVRRKYCTLYN